MSRTRYVSNSRSGIRGTQIQGNVIYLQGPNMGAEIYEADTSPRVPVGTRLVAGDGRVFRYAKATTEVDNQNFGLKFYGQLADGIGYTAPLQTQAIGDTTIRVDAGGAAAVTLDELKGGYILIHTHTPEDNQFRMITGNTLADSDGYTTITVDGPWTIAIATTFGTETLQNPYNNVRIKVSAHGEGDHYSSVAGIPVCKTTAANQYLWLQTWGPIWINPKGTSLLTADVAGERQLVFDYEGAVCIYDDAVGTTAHMQNAGFIIDRTAAGASGPPLVMLQISP